MIFALSAVMLAMQTGAAPADSKFIENLRAYRSCVRSKALVFERAKESVPDTVEASLAACENEMATLVLDSVDAQAERGNEDASVLETGERIDALVVEPLKSETIVVLFEIRSGVR